MRSFLAALCFLAFMAGSGVYGSASAHPGHHGPVTQAPDEFSLFAERLPVEAFAADHRCPAHQDEGEGACALLHVQCCSLHGGFLLAAWPPGPRPLPAGGYRGPGPDPSRSGATGSPLFEPPRT